MSRVLEALKRSEQQHNLTLPIPQSNVPETSEKKAKNKQGQWLLACLLLPSMLWWGAHKVQKHLSLTTVSDLDMTAVVTVEPTSISNSLLTTEQTKVSHLDEVTFVELPFPIFNDLKSTRRETKKDEPKVQALSKHSSVITSKPVKGLTTSTSNKSVNNALTDNLDFGELSPELAQRFKAALQAPTSNNSNPRVQQPLNQSQNSMHSTNHSAIALDTHQAQFYGRLPKLDLQGHMYSSNVRFSSVKVNQKEFFEGDWITPDVKLLTITPRTIEVQFNQQRVSIPALFEWRG